MSRGLANCSPGNIRQSKTRYQGEVVPSRDKAFKQFQTMAWGYRAMFVFAGILMSASVTARSDRS